MRVYTLRRSLSPESVGLLALVLKDAHLDVIMTLF